MRDEFGSLRGNQWERGLEGIRAAQVFPRPERGWIRTVREAEGISAAKLGRILGVSRQLPLQFEKAEMEDSITLKSLRAVAEALGCELVYALVPRRPGGWEPVEVRAAAQDRVGTGSAGDSIAVGDRSKGRADDRTESGNSGRDGAPDDSFFCD